jgi:D-sedoheptulose 7-phosphate isomerase
MMPSDRDPVTRDLRALAQLASVVADSMAEDIAAAVEVAAAALDTGGKLMFCGNGGSAADAQHLATEYVVRLQRDRPPLPALALTTDTSLLTAAANDYGFEYVFARQVRALGRPGDVLFLHSTSGQSPNLLRAAEAAREGGVITIALLARGGGDLAAHVDHALVLPTDDSARAQEVQLAIGHIICKLVEERMHARHRSEG